MLNKEQLEIIKLALQRISGRPIRELTAQERTTAFKAHEYITDLIEGNMIAEYWTIDDVKSLLEEGDNITDEEAREVLKRVEHDHDANIGINWDVLEAALNAVRAGR